MTDKEVYTKVLSLLLIAMRGMQDARSRLDLTVAREKANYENLTLTIRHIQFALDDLQELR